MVMNYVSLIIFLKSTRHTFYKVIGKNKPINFRLFSINANKK